MLNRRTYNRYIMHVFSVGDIGVITDISKGGMRIKKTNNEEIMGSKLTVSIAKNEVEADIVWQDKEYIGLRYTAGFDAVQLIKRLTRKIKEPEIRPKKIIPEDAVAGITQKDVLCSCINLIEELENPDIDMTKLKTYVEEISDVCRETAPPEEKKSEEIEEMKEPEPVKPADIKGLLIYEARRASSAKQVEIADIDFAIVRLGLESVRQISIDFVRSKLSDLKISLSNFNNYEAFMIFKTVMFKHLTHLFGFKDAEGEESLLLSLETKGIDILMSLNSADRKDIKDYYISSSRVYSEISRIYEKNNFGRDMLLINKSYFENKLGRFEDLYDGYILAHLILNPCYRPDDIKLTLTKRKLIYSFLVYLTFIATRFIMDRDKESAFLLIHMLKRAGMDEREIMDFLSDGISEANDVLKNLGLKGNIRSGPLPGSSFKTEGYLHRDIHFKYLVKSFKDFSMSKNISRMALRYEDEAYAHFILTKLLIADDIGLNAKAYCVIPCKNISEHELYLEAFAYFDLVILKDIDRLPRSHIKAFVKLWNSFEGKVIVTFSNYSFLDLDLDNEYLYLLLKNHIVDFPSYFSNKEIYEKMIEHTIDYMRPHLGKHVIDKNDYLSDICSMDYIKANELRSYV
jgi:hypothetical protein